MALLLRSSRVTSGSPKEIVLESGQIIIGQLTSNQLVLPGVDIDPIHAVVEVDEQTKETNIIDMGSEKGVILNGTKIDVVATLKKGDVIYIGSIKIDVLDASEQEVPGAIQEQQKQKRIVHQSIFSPQKLQASGSTLEVVAYWEQSILDVRHYGKSSEKKLEKVVMIGNEEDGHIIGVGPRADVRNYKIGQVDSTGVTLSLNEDMKAKIRQGKNFQSVQGPTVVPLNRTDAALVKHGPLSYFFYHVALPKLNLPHFPDLDGKPIIFLYAMILYIGAVASIVSMGPVKPKEQELDAWSTYLNMSKVEPKPIPQVKPPVKVEPPKLVELPKAKPVPPPPPPKPKPTPPSVDPAKLTPKAAQKPSTQAITSLKPPQVKPPTPVAKLGGTKGETKSTDKALGPQSKAPAGNSGGPKGGTSGAFASARQGNQKTSAMGVENKPTGPASGINLDKLAAGLGKTMDIDAVGKVSTGLSSQGGGLSGGSGSSKDKSYGLGGLGKGNTVSTGGPGRAVAGIGGGAGGLGAGGSGGPGGASSDGSRKALKAEAIVVPEGDPVVEGSLTREEIESVIKAHLSEIKICYERSLQGNKGLSGRIMTQFVIGSAGRVTSASISQSGINNSGLESCIVSAVKRWKFPNPRGGGSVNVSYPFMFSPLN